MARASHALAKAREELAWDLAIRGHSQPAIARILEKKGLGSITRQGVSVMLQRVARRLEPELRAKAEEQVSKQIAAYTHVYNEAMRAWHRSKTGGRQISQKINTLAANPPTQPGQPPLLTPGAARAGQVPSDYTLTVLKDVYGESEYLKRAMEALDRIRKLLGLDAPVRTELAGVGVTAGSAGGGVVLYLPHNGRDPLPEGGPDPEPESSDGGLGAND